jgi:hypothetical protein
LFSPVGAQIDGENCPPLTITEEALREGIAALSEAVQEGFLIEDQTVDDLTERISAILVYYWTGNWNG